MPVIAPRSVLFACLLVLGGLDGWSQWRHRPRHPPDGELAANDPLQTDTPADPTLTHGRWTMTPRAHYDITARILSTERYRFDRMAGLAPEDLALGWGPMSDTRILKTLDIAQSTRFYWWRPHSDTPIPREEIISHSANTHVIPADSAIASRLAELRVGEVVRLTGKLVDATRDDGAWIHTSLSRLDTGDGACEVMLVESVETKWP